MKRLESFVEKIPSGDLVDNQMGATMFAQALRMVDFGRVLPAWWSRQRDIAMREKWRDDGMMLAGFMYAAQNKIVNMPIKVVARDPNIESHNKHAVEINEQFHALSEYGNGLSVAMTKFSEDMFATDNGAFFEVVADGPVNTPISNASILGIRHLDSLHVTRYNDPIHPYGYRVRSNEKELRYHHSRIIAVSQMPSSSRDMNGVGYCAVSRSVEIAQRFADMNRYLRGKMGGVSAKKILVGKNIQGEEIYEAIVTGVTIAESIGEMDAETIAIGGMDVDLKAVDVYNYPELDEERAVLAMMIAMSIAWGIELNEVYPISGSKSGDEVALQRSRGKMPAAFVSQLERQMTFRLVPPHLKVVIDYDDDLQDKERAIIDDINARQIERLVTSGVVSTWMAARKLFKEGRLTDTEFLELSLDHGMMPDGTPVQRAFVDQEYDNLLTIDPVYISGSADPEVVRTAIAADRLLIYAAYPKTTSQVFHRRCRIALGALDWLEKLYGLNAPINLQPSREEEEEDDSPRDEEDEQEDGQQASREESSESIDGSETKGLLSMIRRFG